MNVILFCKPESAKITYPYFSKVTSSVQRYFADSCRIQTVESGIDAEQLHKIIDFWRPAGAVVAASSGIGVFTRRNLRPLPVVYLDPPSVSASSFNVVQDNETDARTAATELLSSDVRHYAFVGGPKPFRWSEERGKAFMEGMRLATLPCSRFKRDLPEGDYLKELSVWLRDLPKPCGVFADNDITAGKVIEICSALKIRIPEEIILVGCDNNVDICEKTSVSISSVCPDYEHAAILCARLLESRMNDPTMKPCTVKYGVSGLIRRASSCRVQKHDRRVASAIKLIHAKVCGGITVADVASELGCSVRLIQMRFRSATGTTMKEFISDVRMERVKTMLKTASVPVSDIAKACGYGTDAALRIAFRKKHGMSMNGWRLLYRNKH